MNDSSSISPRTLVYCLLTGRDHVSEAAVPDSLGGFEGADRIITDIVDAAIKGIITFHGKPTQTRLPIHDDVFDDSPEAAIRRAAALLRRPFANDTFKEAILAKRFLSDSLEAIPAHVWDIDLLVWEANHLLIWDSASLDDRFEECEAAPEWVENPQMLQPLEKSVSVDGNPFLRDLPQYDPMVISGYSHLECNAAQINVLRQTGSVTLPKPKALDARTAEAGRPSSFAWPFLERAAEALLRDGEVPKGTWGEVLKTAIEKALDDDLSPDKQRKMKEIKLDSWKSHLRTKQRQGSTLLTRLDDARQ